MGEVLSQSEIDALLNALTNGDITATEIPKHEELKHVKEYNFARPSKFNKEQLRTLHIIFDNYARLLSSYMTGYLRMSTIIEVINSEQLTYNEFNNSLSSPEILAIVDFSPLKGSIILELTANIGYSIIDRVLGGTGKTIKKIRDFSEIEKILIERVVVQMLAFLEEPWENVSAIKPRLEKIETNSQFAQIMSPNEMIALVTLTIKIGEIEGFINFCLPHMVIEPIVSRLNTKFWFGDNEDEDKSFYKEQLEEQLERTKIPIAAQVGRTSITVSEFINLQVGDIITLDSYINSDLNVMVGNLLKFNCKPGINRGKNAIQITSIVGRED